MVDFNINECILDIDKLKPNSWNPNEESEFMQEKLNRSMKTFGQVEEVLVRQLPAGNYEIIDGEHRWNELKKSGETKIIANNLGEISDEDAKLLTMVANELHGNRNPVKLAAILRDFEKEDDWKEIASLMPYNEIELSNLIAIDPDATPPPEFDAPGKGKGKEKDDSKTWVDIKISIHNEKRAAIEELMKKSKATMGIPARPDQALENGELLKRLVITA